jgi:DnaJ-class molecular chaperone
MFSKPRNGLLFVLFSLSLCLNLTTGCKTYSNLDQRPQWAFAAGAEIPASHPQHKDYSDGQYLTYVSEGRGQGVSAARGACQMKAEASFAKQVFVKVMAKRNSKSELTTKYDSDGKSSQRGVELVNESIETVSRQFLSAVKGLTIWDQGFVIDENTDAKTNYCYGAYVLEKESAGKQALNHSKKCLSRLESIASSSSINASTAIDGLRDVLEFDLASTTANFFGKKAPRSSKIGSWKQKFKSIVINEGSRLEQTGRETDLEEALAYYETCDKLDPEGGWKGRVLGVKRKLPCLLCGGGKKCTNCNGAGGFDNDCTVCGGTKIARPQCPKCKGAGQARCPKCNGSRTVRVPCPPKIKCKVCRATGTLNQVCSTCDGTGQTQQRGNDGTIFDQACTTCAQSGSVAVACYNCNGKRQVQCDICDGTGKKKDSCPTCNGRGLYGDCKVCKGKGQIEERCNNCKPNGKVWTTCKECQGSKNCKVCKGKGYRS